MLDKTYRPDAVEARLYEEWERSGHFACDPHSDKRPYAIMMPPPNVTGSLHMGHALTFTIQDILIRFERMRGRDVLWQPGTDHAGIATEIVVTNQLAEAQIKKHDLGREAFIERVWEWKEQSGGAITRQLRRLGVSADWARERFTMDAGLSAAVRRVFVTLYREGLIYRDKRLVNWDPEMHTVISDLEVENRETKGNLWHIRYPVEDMPGRFLTVATTRPETMLGDTGVAVHPDDTRYTELVGKKVRLPLVGRLIPIVADEYADPEMGSGAVKVTPAHDFNDFEVGRRHGLEIINIFNRDARVVIQSSPFDRLSHDELVWLHSLIGLDRFLARTRIVERLVQLDLVEKIEDHALMVPHHDRSGVVIEPWLTDQWFCNAAELAKPAIAAVKNDQTRFVPRNWENTFFDWLRNIQPWCISRQLWWGHQIPVWYGRKRIQEHWNDDTRPYYTEDNPEMFVAESEAAAKAMAEERYGCPVTVLNTAPRNFVDEPFQRIINDEENGQPYRELIWRDPDVLDTWFSSGLWPFSTLGWPEETPELKRYYPGDVLVTGFDIIFFWVARMMMQGIHFRGEVPFKTVYIHALVRDERGQKMSKSRGNIVDPLDLIDRFGCDALRFTLGALASPGRNINLAESRIEGYRNFVTKLWNAARYAEMYDCALEACFDPGACKETENRWIVGAASNCAAAVTAALDAYRFDEAANTLYQFVWGTFCDWYIELTKPILQDQDGPAKDETRATTAWVLGRIVHLLHPLMPFVTEELWGHLTGGNQGLLMTAAWPGPTSSDPVATAEMEWTIAAISAIRGVRSEINVPPGAYVPYLVKDMDADGKAYFASNSGRLLRLARIAPMEASASIAGGLQVVVEGATFILDVGDVVDLGREKARLGKEIAKFDAELNKMAAKLTNSAFLSKAKPEIIEEQREREADARRDRDRLQAAYERLEVI